MDISVYQLFQWPFSSALTVSHSHFGYPSQQFLSHSTQQRALDPGSHSAPLPRLRGGSPGGLGGHLLQTHRPRREGWMAPGPPTAAETNGPSGLCGDTWKRRNLEEMEVSWNIEVTSTEIEVTFIHSKSSILIGISIIKHPFGGSPILGNHHMDPYGRMLVLNGKHMGKHMGELISLCFPKFMIGKWSPQWTLLSELFWYFFHVTYGPTPLTSSLGDK